MARCFALIVIVAGAAVAAPNPKATALARDAERLYKDGQYREAAKLLDEALQLEPNPKLLYNMARALDQASEVQPAMDAYRKYVSLPSTDTEPELVKKANLSMDRLRGLLARQESDTREREKEKDRLEREAREAKARADAEAEKARQQKAQFDAKERARSDAQQTKVNGRKVAAFVVGGVALASLTTGLVLGLVSNGSKQAFRLAETVADKRARQGDTVGQAIAADVFLGVGLAAAITAFILFPFGQQEPAPVSLVPIPGGALGTVGFDF